jgi:biotin carboxyl carrier protein
VVSAAIRALLPESGLHERTTIRRDPDLDLRKAKIRDMVQPVTQDDIFDILDIFSHSASTHLDLTVGSTRVVANRQAAPAISAIDLPRSTAHVVAPILGVFQAAPEQGAPAFVEPGSQVETDTTIGLIRVMQNRTAVKAGLCGKVMDIAVTDGQFVEFGQTLLRVNTNSAASGGTELDGTNAR